MDKRWLWGVAVLYVVVIYASLPVARYLVEYIYRTFGRPTVGVLVTTGLVVVAIVLAMAILNSRVSLSSRATALVLLATGGLVSLKVGLPEEKIHFVEYGLLGYILFRATSTWARPVAASFVMVSIVGSLDEAIQWALPQRVGDLKDIALNTLGGAIGINVAWVYGKGR